MPCLVITPARCAPIRCIRGGWKWCALMGALTGTCIRHAPCSPQGPVPEGTPAQVAADPASVTGSYLRPYVTASAKK
jgi:hypothetical protein